MRQFLKKLAVFFGTALLLAVAIQVLVSLRVKDANIHGNQTLHLANQTADLVLLGSSRALAHFDPQFFENTFGLETVNIAVNGHSEIGLTTLRVENYLSKNKTPRFAIFNFDPFASADSVNVQDNFTIKDDFARYAFWPDARDLPILDFFKFNTAEKYIPAYAIFKYKLLQSHLFPKRSRYDEFGYENNNEHWDTLKLPATGVMKKHYFKNTDIPAIAKSLRQLDQICKKHHIKLLCIQTPVYKSVYEKNIFSRNKTICEKLGILYIDMESETFRNNIRYFYNSNHMNRDGVGKMNALLEDNLELRKFLEK
jgi:hypothetical protein